MRPDLVVVVAPKRQLSSGIGQAVEQFLVQQLVTQAEAEAKYYAKFDMQPEAA
jgi:hypothetical protein